MEITSRVSDISRVRMWYAREPAIVGAHTCAAAHGILYPRLVRTFMTSMGCRGAVLFCRILMEADLINEPVVRRRAERQGRHSLDSPFVPRMTFTDFKEKSQTIVCAEWPTASLTILFNDLCIIYYYKKLRYLLNVMSVCILFIFHRSSDKMKNTYNSTFYHFHFFFGGNSRARIDF